MIQQIRKAGFTSVGQKVFAPQEAQLVKQAISKSLSRGEAHAQRTGHAGLTAQLPKLLPRVANRTWQQMHS